MRPICRPKGLCLLGASVSRPQAPLSPHRDFCKCRHWNSSRISSPYDWEPSRQGRLSPTNPLGDRMATTSLYIPPNPLISSPTLVGVFSNAVFNCLSYCFTVLRVGINTWVQFHAMMVVMLPKFNRTTQACRKKFNQIFASYKEDKLINSISGNNWQKSNFTTL